MRRYALGGLYPPKAMCHHLLKRARRRRLLFSAWFCPRLCHKQGMRVRMRICCRHHACAWSIWHAPGTIVPVSGLLKQTYSPCCGVLIALGLR